MPTEIEKFQRDLLESVQQMKRGEAARTMNETDGFGLGLTIAHPPDGELDAGRQWHAGHGAGGEGLGEPRETDAAVQGPQYGHAIAHPVPPPHRVEPEQPGQACHEGHGQDRHQRDGQRAR